MTGRFFVLVLLFGGIYPTLGLSNSQIRKSICPDFMTAVR